MSRLTHRKRRAGALLTMLLGLAVSGAHGQSADVSGLWSSGNSLLEVRPRGEGLSMTIIAIRDAVYEPDEPAGEPGKPRRDDNNPDPARQERLLVGLELLSDYVWTGRRWEGKIYDPESGKTYSSQMERDGGRLKMRGYIGVPMLGRTRFFQRVMSCDAPVRDMAAASNVDLALCD